MDVGFFFYFFIFYLFFIEEIDVVGMARMGSIFLFPLLAPY